MLTIVDYGVGNLRSVYMAFRRLGIETRVTSEPADVRSASAVVLPGVGAFGDSIENLRALNLEEPVVDAIAAGTPFLGICVGLQLLFEVGEEMGEHRGLGVLAGRVVRFQGDLTVPHMGWNQINKRAASPILADVAEGAYAYFVHSYYAASEDEAIVAATTDYGGAICSAVARDNLFAIQFHPEKSQDTGEAILRGFCRYAGEPLREPAS